MSVWDSISRLSWQSSGEAKAIYDEFIKAPDYSPQAPLEKLLICLVYERQYAAAVSLSKGIITTHETSFHGWLFLGVASDMLYDRTAAVEAYNAILNRKLLSPMQSYAYSQLGIHGAGTDFIRFLIEHSYEKVGAYTFRNPFEHVFRNERMLRATPHYTIFYFPNSTAEREIESICTEREMVYEKVVELLKFDKEITIDLYFYEDGKTKAAETGHTGAGWAYGNAIVEIYNAHEKINPFHELVHIIAHAKYGHSVSAFSEGLAVYACNQFDAAGYEDGINDEYVSKVRHFYSSGQLFGLVDLLGLQIGSVESRPGVSYPQAAAFVHYAIDVLGKGAFFELYAALQADYTEFGVIENVAKIEQAFGSGIADIEAGWSKFILYANQELK